jgi:hypothetical protein
MISHKISKNEIPENPFYSSVVVSCVMTLDGKRRHKRCSEDLQMNHKRVAWIRHKLNDLNTYNSIIFLFAITGTIQKCVKRK